MKMIATKENDRIKRKPSVSEEYSSESKPERKGERKYPKRLKMIAAKEDPIVLIFGGMTDMKIPEPPGRTEPPKNNNTQSSPAAAHVEFTMVTNTAATTAQQPKPVHQPKVVRR
mmetsp:Transcript_22500/g.33552  ORF Transcript_22500/g.33552 Transcript_22500/m.33552 type:complete len:114 (-) Transcript_22500:1433-1774(-)